MSEIIDWLGKSGDLPHWLEILTIVSTAAAAALAALAIMQAGSQAKRSAEAIQRERRIDFELGVLSDLLECAERPYANFARRWPLLAPMLPVELIPLTRASLNLESTDEAKARVEARRAESDGRHGNMVDLLKVAIKEELLAAVSTRLNERSTPVGNRQGRRGLFR